MAKIDKTLKKRYGKNSNIEIREGEIYMVTQGFDKETGSRNSKRIRTGLKAENYFDKVTKFMLFIIINELEFSDYTSIAIKINRSIEDNTVYYIIELIVCNINETKDE